VDEDEIAAALMILDGQRVRCRAVVDRFGSRPAHGGGTETIIHLRDVVEASTGRPLRERLWSAAGDVVAGAGRWQYECHSLNDPQSFEQGPLQVACRREWWWRWRPLSAGYQGEFHVAEFGQHARVSSCLRFWTKRLTERLGYSRK
jgi:hypothetical protein